jgi:hypothetical protein
MFRIPEVYEVEMSFNEAVSLMTSRGRGDLLEGMLSMDRFWIEYCACPDQDDDALFHNWCYEFSAYNVVYQGMSELFAEAA